MTKPRELTAGTTEADTEMELSAEDLLALSGPRTTEQPDVGAATHQSEPMASSPVISAVRSASQPEAQTATSAANRGMAVSRIALPLGLVATAVAAAGALYTFKPVDGAGESSVTIAQEPVAQPEITVPEPEVESEPVRFTNPFDETEVFEFPAGTSQAEARDAVREMLMARAIERRGKR